jgi:hypothetical protein
MNMESKPRFKVRACEFAWSFSDIKTGKHLGAIFYDGRIGGICWETLCKNPQLK